MVVRFEEMLGIESSVGWAQREACDIPKEQDPVVVQVPDGTPGQHFHVELMQELFAALGLNIAVNE